MDYAKNTRNEFYLEDGSLNLEALKGSGCRYFFTTSHMNPVGLFDFCVDGVIFIDFISNKIQGTALISDIEKDINRVYRVPRFEFRINPNYMDDIVWQSGPKEALSELNAQVAAAQEKISEIKSKLNIKE